MEAYAALRTIVRRDSSGAHSGKRSDGGLRYFACLTRMGR
jgi:hypothetical protein